MRRWLSLFAPYVVYCLIIFRNESFQQPFAVVATSAGFRANYDRNGNMLTRVEISGTQTITYVQEWTIENRLAVVTNTVSGAVTRFVYDGACSETGTAAVSYAKTRPG